MNAAVTAFQSALRQHPKRFITAGITVVLVITAAVIGHAIADGESITTGDCVVMSPNSTSGWDIQQVGCAAQTNQGQFVDQVTQVLSGGDRTCYNLGDGGTTFNDRSTDETYCLEPYANYGP